MTTLLALIAVVAIVSIAVMAVAGALRVSNADREVNITIDKAQLKAKTEQAVEKTKDFGVRIAEKTREVFSNPPTDGDAAQPSNTSEERGSPTRSQADSRGEVSEKVTR